MKMFNKDLINWAGLKDVDPEKAKDTVLDASAGLSSGWFPTSMA